MEVKLKMLKTDKNFFRGVYTGGQHHSPTPTPTRPVPWASPARATPPVSALPASPSPAIRQAKGGKVVNRSESTSYVHNLKQSL